MVKTATLGMAAQQRHQQRNGYQRWHQPASASSGESIIRQGIKSRQHLSEHRRTAEKASK